MGCPTSSSDTELWLLLAGVPQARQAQANGDFSQDIRMSLTCPQGLLSMALAAPEITEGASTPASQGPGKGRSLEAPW